MLLSACKKNDPEVVGNYEVEEISAEWLGTVVTRAEYTELSAKEEKTPEEVERWQLIQYVSFMFDMTLKIKADGSCEGTVNGETSSATWRVEGNQLLITATVEGETETQIYQITSDGKIVMAGDGVTVTFVKV